jgi:beta-xylosidase
MQDHNPVIRHKFTADPTVLVYGDTVWLFTGHDESPPGTHEYKMNDWLCFSSQNLVHWKEHPVPLKAIDFNWASGDAFASKVIAVNNKFYWYVAVSHKTIAGKAIGLAVSDNPEGPFTDAIGSALITGDMLPVPVEEKINLDPTVLVEEDGNAFIFWGNQHCFYAALDKDLRSISSPVREILLPSFSEGAHLHYRNGG